MMDPRTLSIARRNGHRLAITGLLGVLLLASCGAPNTQTPVAATYRYTAAVPVEAGATESGIAARYGGTVVVWHPEAGFAVLGLSRPIPEGQLRGLSLNGTPDETVVSEPNSELFEASGTSSAWSDDLNAAGSASIWSGGSASIWSGGSAVIWSGGTGVVGGIPENTPAWTQIGLPAAWLAAPKLGQGVKVAVIDSGIDLAHPMFQGALVSPADQWDFVGNDAVPQEEGTFTDAAYGHGTNVAGIVLQLAPHAQIMPLRALRPDGSGDQTTVAAAINYAVLHGAQVINLSLGSTQKTQVIQTMIQYATARGVNVVASSGNTGDTRVTYPAQYARDGGNSGDLTFSVGSVDPSDHKSSFSTYGGSIELAAPGERVWGPVPGNLFSYWSGTSMAAPMVAGALALGRAQAPTLAPAALSAALLQTAAPLNILNPGTPIGARLNVGAFVQAITLPTLPLPPH